MGVSVFASGEYPNECPAGHELKPGHVTISWMPCDCPGVRGQPAMGHHVVRCGTAGCTAAWYDPPHEPPRPHGR
jgi:hypothetical protein